MRGKWHFDEVAAFFQNNSRERTYFLKDQNDCTKLNEGFYATVHHNLRRIKNRIKTQQAASSTTSCSVENFGLFPSNFGNSFVKTPECRSWKKVQKSTAFQKRLHATMTKNDARLELFRKYRLAKTRNKFDVKDSDQRPDFSSQLPLFCQGGVLKVSNNFKNRCFIKKKDGSYRYKTIYVIPLSRKMTKSKIFSQSYTSHRCKTRYPRKQFKINKLTDVSNNFLVSDGPLTNDVDPDGLLGYRRSEQSMGSKSVFFSSMPQQSNSKNSFFKTTRFLSECSIDEQIDPFVTMNPSKEVIVSSSNTSLLFRLMSFIRKTLKPKEAEPNFPRSKPTLFQRFQSVLHALRNSSSISTIATARSGLSCWTCLEMDADDEILSSVDSGDQ